jgi:hypothetical protein
MPDSKNITHAGKHGFFKSYRSQLGLISIGVTQFDCQPFDFIQLAIYAAKRQLAVIVELLISTA